MHEKSLHFDNTAMTLKKSLWSLQDSYTLVHNASHTTEQ